MDEEFRESDEETPSNAKYEIRVQIDGYVFDISQIYSMNTSNQLCDIKFEIGKTACGEIYLEIVKPKVEFRKMAEIIPSVRRNDESVVGEWSQRGVYYIDTRKEELNGDDDILVITGYDGMLKTSKDFGNLGLSYPAKTKDVVVRIASLAGISVEASTLNLLDDGQTISEPEYLTGRQILEGIAAMYGGSFMMNFAGNLQLVDMSELLTM